MNAHIHLTNMGVILQKLIRREGLNRVQHRDFRNYSNLAYLEREVQPNVSRNEYRQIEQLHQDLIQETVRIAGEALQPAAPAPAPAPAPARSLQRTARRYAQTPLYSNVRGQRASSRSQGHSTRSGRSTRTGGNKNTKRRQRTRKNKNKISWP